MLQGAFVVGGFVVGVMSVIPSLLFLSPPRSVGSAVQLLRITFIKDSRPINIQLLICYA